MKSLERNAGIKSPPCHGSHVGPILSTGAWISDIKRSISQVLDGIQMLNWTILKRQIARPTSMEEKLLYCAGAIVLFPQRFLQNNFALSWTHKAHIVSRGGARRKARRKTVRATFSVHRVHDTPPTFERYCTGAS